MIVYCLTGDKMQFNAKRSLVVFDKPNDFKKNYIGEGCNGICYLISNGKQVYKEMKHDQIDAYLLKQFTYFDSDVIAYPRRIVYKDQIDDKNIIGYIYDYVEGKRLDEIDDSENIHDIINASNDFEEGLKKEAERGIFAYDPNPIYTPDKKIKLVDTDAFEMSYDEIYYIYKCSMQSWGDFMLHVLKMNYNFIYNNPKIHEYFMLLVRQGKMKPSKFIQCILDEIERQTNQNVQTVKDFKEGQELILKKK